MKPFAKIYTILNCPKVDSHEVPLLVVDENLNVRNAGYKLHRRNDGSLHIPGCALEIELAASITDEDKGTQSEAETIKRVCDELRSKNLLPEEETFVTRHQSQVYEFEFKHPAEGKNNEKMEALNLGDFLKIMEKSSLQKSFPDTAWENQILEVRNLINQKTISGKEFLSRCRNHYTPNDIVRLCGGSSRKITELALAVGASPEEIREKDEEGWIATALLTARHMQYQPVMEIRTYIKDEAYIRYVGTDNPKAHEQARELEKHLPTQVIKQNVEERAWIVIAEGQLRCARTGATATYDKSGTSPLIGMPIPNGTLVHLQCEMREITLDGIQPGPSLIATTFNLELTQTGVGLAKVMGSFNAKHEGEITHAKELEKAGILIANGATNKAGYTKVRLIDPEMKDTNTALQKQLQVEKALEPKIEPEAWIEAIWDASIHFPKENPEQWMTRVETRLKMTSRNAIFDREDGGNIAATAFTCRPEKWSPKSAKTEYNTIPDPPKVSEMLDKVSQEKKQVVSPTDISIPAPPAQVGMTP